MQIVIMNLHFYFAGNFKDYAGERYFRRTAGNEKSEFFVSVLPREKRIRRALDETHEKEKRAAQSEPARPRPI